MNTSRYVLHALLFFVATIVLFDFLFRDIIPVRLAKLVPKKFAFRLREESTADIFNLKDGVFILTILRRFEVQANMYMQACNAVMIELQV